MDIRPELQAALDAFGLPAIVTLPDADPAETTAFWLPPDAVDVPVGAGDLRRAERRRQLVLPREDVPEVPRGTLIEMAEEAGAATQLWRVDAADRPDSDHHRVLVLPEAP